MNNSAGKNIHSEHRSKINIFADWHQYDVNSELSYVVIATNSNSFRGFPMN